MTIAMTDKGRAAKAEMFLEQDAAEAKLTTWGSGAGAITYVWYRK